MHDHERHMRLAIEAAELATRAGNPPYGAVLVGPDGDVVTTGHNRTHELHDPSSHAELNAVRDACRKLRTLALPGSRMYASGQPCPMCMSVIIATGIAACHYAAPASPEATLISPEELVERAGPAAPVVVRGPLADEAIAMMARHGR
jgi:tRNA(adenine34) deaminase